MSKKKSQIMYNVLEEIKHEFPFSFCYECSTFKKQIYGKESAPEERHDNHIFRIRSPFSKKGVLKFLFFPPLISIAIIGFLLASFSSNEVIISFLFSFGAAFFSFGLLGFTLRYLYLFLKRRSTVYKAAFFLISALWLLAPLTMGLSKNILLLFFFCAAFFWSLTFEITMYFVEHHISKRSLQLYVYSVLVLGIFLVLPYSLPLNINLIMNFMKLPLWIFISVEFGYILVKGWITKSIVSIYRAIAFICNTIYNALTFVGTRIKNSCKGIYTSIRTNIPEPINTIYKWSISKICTFSDSKIGFLLRFLFRDRNQEKKVTQKLRKRGLLHNKNRSSKNIIPYYNFQKHKISYDLDLTISVKKSDIRQEPIVPIGNKRLRVQIYNTAEGREEYEDLLYEQYKEDQLLEKKLQRYGNNFQEKREDPKTPILTDKIKYIGIFLSIFGIILILSLNFASPSLFMFPHEVKAGYFLLEIIFVVFSYLFCCGNKKLEKLNKVYLGLSTLILLWTGLICYIFDILNLAYLFPLVALLGAIIARLMQKFDPARLSYHTIKFPLLWFFISIFLIGFVGVFILAPQWRIIPVIGIFASIILFTFEASSAIRRRESLKKKRKLREKGIRNSNRSLYEDRHVGAAVSIIIFLNIFTLFFAVNSIAPVNFPNVQFAGVSPIDRVEGSVDYSELDYYSSLENLDDLSINDMFVIRGKISLMFWESATFLVQLIPQDVEPVDSYFLKSKYEYRSKYVHGPKIDYTMTAKIPLNKLELLPGTYKVKIYYGILTGFGLRTSNTQEYNLTIGKDNLQILSNERFSQPLEMGIPYGAVYTFENINESRWEVIFDGKLVDSLHKAIPDKNLTLFIEDHDRYQEIASVITDSRGKFYLNHTIYGSIEQNMMVKVEYSGNERYNPLRHEEYAGLEVDIHGQRFFHDENRNGLPDWPYTLYDLLDLLGAYGESSPPSSLDFYAEFNENSGTSTYDTIHNYEGTLEGDTSWDNGVRDSAPLFDGNGTYTGGATIGSTIYNAYANVSYEYESGGSGFVTSVQQKELIFSSSDVSKSASLDVGTNINNCVPFVTLKENVGDDWDDIMCDVYFTDSPATVVAQRSTAGATITLSIFIVEFDGVNVEVQDGTFSATGTYSEQTISHIDTTKAVPMAYYKVSGGDDDWDSSMVTTDFVGTTTVRMERHASSGTMSGHYYVFEAQGSEFSVQKAELSMTSSEGYDTATINSVTMSKSFIVSSYESDRANDDPEDAALDVFLNSGTEVRAERHTESLYYNGFPTINVFVITFSGDENVQRGDFTWANADTYKETDITAVDLDASMIKSGNMYGIMQCDGTGSADVKSSFAQHKFVDSDTIRLERYTNSEDAKGHWEVVQWELGGGGQIQDNDIVRPNGDISTEWEASHAGNHADLINETTLDINDYIYTSSIASSNITDEFDMGTFDISSGTITEIQVEVYGKEIDINSVINVFCGTWLGAKQLDMGTSPQWHTYTWSGLSLSQADLEGMKIKFESETPPDSGGTYEDFDYVDFGDILDDTLGITDDEFIITAWVHPTAFTSNVSDNGIKNCFFSKTGIIELGVNESGYLQVYLNVNGVETSATYGFPGAITLNDWTYIAVRYNMSDVDVFLDDIWCRTALGGTAEPWDGGENLKEGGKITVGAETTSYSCFTGLLDEVSVFNSSISDAEVESHEGGAFLKIAVQVSKEDGLGGWVPITTSGEIIEGYLNFECNSTGKPISVLELYLSDTEPDLQNPDPNDWNLLTSLNYDSDYYSFVESSVNIPDDTSWYFVVKAEDDINTVLYDSYSIYFGIEHFSELINFTYLDKDEKINHNSQIGVIPLEDYDWHIHTLALHINYSDDIDYLTTVNYSQLYANFWLIYLDSLSDWVASEGLSPGEYDVNFIVEANLTYGSGFPYYSYNYTLEDTILDILGPDITLLSGDPYSLVLEKTYDDVSENLITMAIESTDSDFNKVKVEYKYETPTSADWLLYGTFYANNESHADIVFDMLNLRDDQINFRFIGYDDLDNEKILSASNYWIVKDFNNHIEIVVEGLDNSQLYGLDQDDMIDLDLKVLPVDNDITRVTISSSYDNFELDNVISEQDHIYFTDDGVNDPDIKLNSSKYYIFGSEFCFIPIEVKLYQGTIFVTSKQVIMAVITTAFSDVVQISNLTIELVSDTDNIWMSFTNDLDAYNNSHSIPFIPSGNAPVLKVYNSHNELVEVISLSAYLDNSDSETYNISDIEIKDNRFIVPLPSPQSGEVCSIEKVTVNGTSYDFTYFINTKHNELMITLDTSKDLDGTYGQTTTPIVIDYGISTSLKISDQFVGSYNFTLLTQDNYTFIG